MPMVLIVDDEADLSGLLEFNLRSAGFDTVQAHDGHSALALAKAHPPDLVLLDLMLPDISGKEVCRRLRKDPALEHVPVVMLTARGDEPDRVAGFEAGADDYVTKPFSVRELMLRVKAVLKRGRAAPAAKVLRHGPLELDVTSHRFRLRGEEVALTALEFRLLEHLLSSKGRVLTREQLLAHVWGITSKQATRTVDTHVGRLRERLGDASSLVETVRGVGYRLKA